MALRQEYAKLSMAAYSGAEPEGWILIEEPTLQQQQSGFYAAAYLNPQTKEIVIAYRGTDDLEDVAADTALSADVTHQQFIDALEFAKYVRDKYRLSGYHISVTGHSLGGGLAQLAADVYGWNGETFDPPGMGQLTDNAQLTAWATQNGQSFGHIGTGFMNNTVSGSAISSVGEHIGGTNSITTTGRPIALVIATAWQVPLPVAIVIAGSDLMERHSIANIYTHLQAQSSAGLVLQEYIDQYLRHGVSGYTPPDQGLFDSFKEFFSDLYATGSRAV